MPESIIDNTRGAHRTVTDFRSNADADGEYLVLPWEVRTYRANEAITKKQAVAFVAPTATVPLSVEVLDVSDAAAALVFAGVALETVAAGDDITIAVSGPVVVNCDDGTPAFGEVAVKHATVDGALISGGTLGGTWDAADVAGTGVGVWLGAEIGTSNTGVVLLRGAI